MAETEVELSRQPRDLRAALVTPLDQMLDYLEVEWVINTNRNQNDDF